MCRPGSEVVSARLCCLQVPLKLPCTPGFLQAEPSQLNAIYSRLLEVLFVEATANSKAKPGQGQPGTKGQAGGNGESGAGGSPGALDLARCTLVAAEWQRQARSCNASLQPQTALAFEAFVVVRMLGQQDFSGEEGTAVALARHTAIAKSICAYMCAACIALRCWWQLTAFVNCSLPPMPLLAAWKVLRGMSSPGQWGSPPSRHTLLLLLRGLAAQLQGGLLPDALPGAVDAAQRLVSDWVAEAETAAEVAASGGVSRHWQCCCGNRRSPVADPRQRSRRSGTRAATGLPQRCGGGRGS